ncbi:MAG: plasmid replication, integration and excision activator [Actinomycetota bacterium]|nr:plasmid replication, integration and excision activator [Actinomycetota bacterium]
MAINGRFCVAMDEVFPHGGYVVSEVEPVRDFDKSTRERPVQALDKESGLPVWSVSVLDADPSARKNEKTVTVKIAAPHQPVPPAPGVGMLFAAVEFELLTVTPYVDDKRGRVAYSFRAREMRAPVVGKASRSSASEAA